MSCHPPATKSGNSAARWSLLPPKESLVLAIGPVVPCAMWLRPLHRACVSEPVFSVIPTLPATGSRVLG